MTAEGRFYGDFAHVAQSAERVLGKDEVTGPNPVVGSEKYARQDGTLKIEMELGGD